MARSVIAETTGREGVDVVEVIDVLAADVGGTFTDVIVRRADGTTAARKIPSTRPAYDEAILLAALELADGATIRRLAHGTTVATNALLERKGARTALVTTEGFRDVLELARLRRPSLFDITFVKPPPLVPRERRLEVRERTAADGACLLEPVREEVDALAAHLMALEVDAVAICLLNAYANPANERLVRDRLIDAWRTHDHDVVVTASADIQREIREFERTSTTVINAYVSPAVSRYVERLRDGVHRRHRTDVVQIMQSNGSLIPAGLATRFPCRLIESGLAAGVLAAADQVAAINRGDAIAFDMGGTTAKAALIEGGHPFEALQLEELLAEQLPDADGAIYSFRLAVRYVGQPTELLIPLELESDLADHADLPTVVRDRFMAEHERTYGYADAHTPMEVVSVRAAHAGAHKSSAAARWLRTPHPRGA